MELTFRRVGFFVVFFWNVVLLVCGYVWWTVYSLSYPLGGVPVVHALFSEPVWGGILVMLAIVTVISIVVTVNFDAQLLMGKTTLEEIGLNMSK